MADGPVGGNAGGCRRPVARGRAGSGAHVAGLGRAAGYAASCGVVHVEVSAPPPCARKFARPRRGVACCAAPRVAGTSPSTSCTSGLGDGPRALARRRGPCRAPSRAQPERSPKGVPTAQEQRRPCDPGEERPGGARAAHERVRCGAKLLEDAAGVVLAQCRWCSHAGDFSPWLAPSLAKYHFLISVGLSLCLRLCFFLCVCVRVRVCEWCWTCACVYTYTNTRTQMSVYISTHRYTHE